MKRTTEIPLELLDNSGSEIFKNDFFSRFKLRHAPEPLKLNETVTKNYLFPTFYGDVTCAIGIFLCSYAKAAELISRELHPDIKPVKMTKGRSLIAFSCYEYKNVLGVTPYNEVAMAIPVMANAKCSPPLLPMIMSTFSHFGYYIAGMPVTSYENQLRGNKIWGLPKVTQAIDIYREGDECVTKVYEENGEAFLTLRVPVIGQAVAFDETSNLYTRLNGRLLQSETNFKATFKVVKNMGLLFKKNAIPDKTFLEISDSPSASVLKFLEIEKSPFQTRYAEHMSSCFDLPRQNVPEWFSELKDHQ